MLGEALEMEFGVDLTIGPALEEGFYYDCYMGEKVGGDHRGSRVIRCSGGWGQNVVAHEAGGWRGGWRGSRTSARVRACPRRPAAGVKGAGHSGGARLMIQTRNQLRIQSQLRIATAVAG